MSNKQQYKLAFSVLQTSSELSLEERKMYKYRAKTIYRNIAVAAAVCFLILGGSVTAYAANVGGIQRTLQLWINGDQTAVTVDFDGAGHYTMEYTDGNGENKTVSGGGVAIDPFGNERPLTEDEIMNHLYNEVNVKYNDDGTVTLYFQDQTVDITDKFENEYCYILLNGADTDLYVTVKYQDGWAVSPNKYPKVHYR